MTEVTPTARAEGEIFDALDHLIDKTVVSSDGQTLGNVTAILHPDSEAIGQPGVHRLAIMPSIRRNMLEGADVAYVPETAIDHVDADAVHLNVTAETVSAQDWHTRAPDEV